MQKSKPRKPVHPSQKQRKPGIEAKMNPLPEFDSPTLDVKKRLHHKVALITGGDSGIGRAIAIGFAKQGCDVAINYLKQEEADARLTKSYIENYGQKCLLLPGDLSRESVCKKIVAKTYAYFKQLDIVINNAGTHYPKDQPEDISTEQLRITFEVNVFAMFHIIHAALPHLKEGASIINTASVTAYRGSGHLIDYAATKGAVISLTRSLASSLADRNIRVNAVAPGPVWTPLIVSSMKAKEIKTFGTDTPMGRPGQPAEIAPCYVFLASEEASYLTGQVLHPNGGEVVNS